MEIVQSETAVSSQQHRMLHGSPIPDFLETAHEWRRLFAETWGTFLLVVVAAGAAVIGARSGEAISLAMKVVAPGLMVMAIIYFMGAVSGAHLNPAVTLAFAARRNFPWSRVPGYIAAQIVGGVAAASFLWAMFGATGSLGATSPASMNPVRSFAPDLIRGDMSTTWIYVAGPVLGALIAVGFEWILKGKPTDAGSLTARGSLK